MLPSVADAGGERTVEILARVRRGDDSASQQLFAHLYGELRSLAESLFRRERVEHTLQPTALIHEAYLRLCGGDLAVAEDRRHFLGMAARAMRRILVEHARAKGAAKRGGGAQRVTLAGLGAEDEDPLDLIALDVALTRLASFDERKARVVELRFFGGLTAAEAGEVLGIARKTVDADWYVARAWLQTELA